MDERATSDGGTKPKDELSDIGEQHELTALVERGTKLKNGFLGQSPGGVTHYFTEGLIPFFT